MDHLEELIEKFKKHSKSERPVEIIETHISWVVLVDEYAYKIKKPVNLGFVDFSSLKKRLHFCKKEIELNGRLAPELYLEVVPVSFSEQTGIQFDSEGEIIDYAVKMHRFSQDALLSHMLSEDQLKPSHVRELALEIARFHSDTETIPADSEYGSPHIIQKAVNDCFDPVAKVTDQNQSELLKKIRQTAGEEFERLKPDFEKRKLDGRIRGCHGDLHPGNVVFLNRKILLFDCIEFNNHFRCIDVISEIAFTVMSLEEWKRPDYAWLLLNQYLQVTGDYAGLKVFRYYLMYRAMVRAKVAAIRLDQSGLDDETIQEEKKLLSDYLKLADQYLHPEKPVILLTHGLSGSGKSTIAYQLAQVFPAVQLRSDVERKRLDSKSERTRTDYSEKAVREVYRYLAELTKHVVAGNCNALVDATFLSAERRQEFYDLAEKLSVPVIVVEMTASEETLRKRIRERSTRPGTVSDADIEVLEKQLESYSPPGEDESGRIIKVNTEQSVDVQELVLQIRKKLMKPLH